MPRDCIPPRDHIASYLAEENIRINPVSALTNRLRPSSAWQGCCDALHLLTFSKTLANEGDCAIMRIGIIRIGNVWRGFGLGWARADHEVLFGNGEML
jgi:Predicted dinucleotide-binding enzymes